MKFLTGFILGTGEIFGMAIGILIHFLIDKKLLGFFQSMSSALARKIHKNNFQVATFIAVVGILSLMVIQLFMSIDSGKKPLGILIYSLFHLALNILTISCGKACYKVNDGKITPVFWPSVALQAGRALPLSLTCESLFVALLSGNLTSLGGNFIFRSMLFAILFIVAYFSSCFPSPTSEKKFLEIIKMFFAPKIAEQGA